jgi:hypothetical protein
VYEVLLSDPLVLADPASGCDLFYVDGPILRFLRSTGSTLREREEQELAAERAREKAEQDAERWRSRQKRVALTIADISGDFEYPSLAEAAREISAAGGRVERELEHGFRVEVPERLNPPGGPGDWTAAQLDRAGRRRLALAAETLAFATSTVVAAIAEAERSKRPLHQVLPDRLPLIGEG